MSSEIKYVSKDNLQTFASSFYKKVTDDISVAKAINYTIPSGTSYYTDSSCTQLAGSVASVTVITVDSDICSFASDGSIYYVSANDVNSDKVISVNENLADINGDIVLTTIAHADNADNAEYAQNAKMALDLESKTQEEQNSEFNFRTSGGSNDILTGTAYLKQIYGNAFNELPRAASITNILAEAPPVGEEPVSLEDWTITLDAATFEDKLDDQKQSGNGQFSYSTSTGWNLKLNNLDKSVSNISEYGLTITPPSGTALPNGLTISFSYVVSSESIHRPITLQEFRSTGFNLYYKETRNIQIENQVEQIDVGIAHVIGKEKYIVKRSDNSSLPIIKFSEDGFSNWTTITTEITTIGLEKYPNTFTPLSDGYIGTFSSDESTNPTYYNNIMINLIWSGKRLDADYEDYKIDIIRFHEQTNNTFTFGVTLDRIDDVADIIDFTVQDSNNYFEKRQRIFNFTYSDNDLDFYFKNIKYIREGSRVYYDCLSVAKHAEEITELERKIFPTIIHKEEVISLIQLTTYDENKNEVQKTNSSYNVDDFGLEEFITITQGLDLDESLPVSADIIYQANLIDKLRRNVITYSLQPDIDDASRATGRQNLQLIFVSCFVGARTVQVTANRIDSVGNVLEYGPKVYSDSISKNAILQLPSLGLWNFSAVIDGKTISINQEISYYGNYDIKLVGKRYGFKRDKRNNSSSGRITYIFDAENFAPITHENNVYHLGDWTEFINEVAEPVFIEPNGAITHLSRQNQHKKSDGNDFSPSSVVNGNYMVAFSKYVYVARKYDSIYDYVVFSDEDLTDENWQYYSYAHDAKAENDEKGNIKLIPNNTFYWGMFPGSYDNRIVAETTPTVYENYLRSIPSQITATAFTYNLADMANTALRTNKTNKNWGIGYKSGWDYINDLITMVTKNDNAQQSFGIGKGLRATYDSYNTDTCFGAGFIHTTEDASSSVGGESTRLFWIWDFYGNIREPLLGFFRRNISATGGIANTYYYIKMENAVKDYLTYSSGSFLPNFPSSSSDSHWNMDDETITSAGYVRLSDKLIGTDKSYIKTDIVNQYGFLPINVSYASSENGIGDWVVSIAANTKVTQYATTGIAATEASGVNLVRNGPRALDFTYYLINNTPAVGTVGSGLVRPRLTYLDRGTIANS